MAVYRVRVQRTMLQEAWIEVEAQGRRLAGNMAVRIAEVDETVAWKQRAVNSLPTSEEEIKIKGSR